MATRRNLELNPSSRCIGHPVARFKRARASQTATTPGGGPRAVSHCRHFIPWDQEETRPCLTGGYPLEGMPNIGVTDASLPSRSLSRAPALPPTASLTPTTKPPDTAGPTCFASMLRIVPHRLTLTPASTGEPSSGAASLSSSTRFARRDREVSRRRRTTTLTEPSRAAFAPAVRAANTHMSIHANQSSILK